MSIYIGTEKENADENEKAQLKQLIKILVDNGYVREPVDNNSGLSILKFDVKEIEVGPAYIYLREQ